MAIKSDLQERYQSEAIQKITDLATFLDPRYKQRLVMEHVDDELLMLEYNNPNKPSNPNKATQQEEAACQEPPTEKHRGPISKLGDLFQKEM